MAVSNVDLEIEEGAILGLIGPNGSGKTTFLNLVNGMLKPSAGEITFFGQDITGVPPHALTRRGIARTFQQNVLFKNNTVWENVFIAHEISYKRSAWWTLFNLSKENDAETSAKESTSQILSEMDLLRWQDKLCGDLPHGIQRMVELAIAVALKPKLMLLDEPFTGMNMSEIAKMIELIHGLRQKKVTILLVEHQMKIVMNQCDRIVVLNFGRKIAEGLPEVVKENEEVIKAYLGDTGYGI